MKLLNKKIAVLEGGPGSERDVSLRSAANVAKGLEALGADVFRIDVRDGDFTLPAGTDLAFNIIHGTFGEDGQVQTILDCRGIPYTGEGAPGSRLAFDKILSKARFIKRGVPTPAYEVIRAGTRPTLPLPLVVKAPRQGSSVGVYLVRKAEELEPALRGAAEFGDDILIEELISGEELTVGVLGGRALPVIMIKPKEGFYDFKNKYPWLNPSGAAEHYCPAPLSKELTLGVQAAALAAHQALDLETYSRVDLILRADGLSFVLEVNTIPGMTESSLLPEAAKVAGIELPELCEEIVRLSLARYENTV